MKSYIKYVPGFLFALYSLKSMFFGIAYYELASMAILGLFATYYHKKDFEEYKKSLDAEKEIMNKRFANVDELLTQLFKNDKEITNQLQTLKIPHTMKMFGNGK